MIEYMKPTDSIFESGAEALVCPVNCVGVMGAGLAKEFKRRFPNYYFDYMIACNNRQLEFGTLHARAIVNTLIISFPTKYHWKEKSDIATIKSGLKTLKRKAYIRDGVKSIAIPALGCGLGGLDWNDVRPLIEEAFKDLPNVRVMLYPPKEEV